MKKYLLLLLFATLTSYAQDVITIVNYRWQNEAWLEHWHDTNHYNDGRRIYHLRKNWNLQTNDWKNTIRTFSFYNQNNVHYYGESEVWNNASNAWQIWSRGYFTYNEDGKPLSQTIQSNTGGTWFDWLVEEFIYDENGFLIENLGKTFDAGNILTHSDKAIYENNPDGSVHVITYQKQNVTTGEWLNDRRETYEYNSIQKVSAITTETWPSIWVLSEKMLYTYDEQHFLIAKHRQIPVNEVLTTSQISQITNDEEGDPLVEIIQLLDFSQNDTWVNYAKIVYLYSTLARQTHEIPNLYEVSPNPAYDQIAVRLTNNKEIAHASITDISGKIMLTQTVSVPDTKIDIERLSAGIYFLKIVQGNQWAVKKIIKN